jgi:hypothetical protein
MSFHKIYVLLDRCSEKKKFQKRNVPTEEKLNDIGALLEASPKKSLRLLAL